VTYSIMSLGPKPGISLSVRPIVKKERRNKVSVNHSMTRESNKADVSLIDQGKRLTETRRKIRTKNFSFFTITKTFTREKLCVTVPSAYDWH
jgi:hypothetical protein